MSHAEASSKFKQLAVGLGLASIQAPPKTRGSFAYQQVAFRLDRKRCRHQTFPQGQNTPPAHAVPALIMFRLEAV
jgi:hypothetical protein